MKKPVKIISISIVALIILGLIFIPKFLSDNNKTGQNQKQNPNQQNQPVSVDVFIVNSRILENEIGAIGNIRANEEVEIRSEVSRKIRGIYFKEGTYVKKGQTLFKLDSDDLVARLRKQEIEEKLAVSKLEREKQLIEKGLTSKEEYEVQENLLEQKRADITITRIDISRTYIRAPFSGIIGLRNVSSGAYVTPSVVLTTIQDISRVKVDFSIPEKYLYLFKKGQKILFSVEGISGEFEAEIYASEPKIENNTRSLVLRAITGNPGGKLLPGTFANVKFKLSSDNNALMIPTQSLIPKLKGQSVFLIRDGKAVLVDVEIGIRTEDMVQVSSGNISPGDSIITTNILRIKNNSPVKVVNAE